MKSLLINSEKFGCFTVLYDNEDHELISSLTWTILKGNKTYYARTSFNKNGKQTWALMHRLILCIDKRNSLTDHKNGNGLDNRRGNLRVVNNSQNLRNSSLSRANKTGFKGVSKINKKIKAPYRAQIFVNNKLLNLGLHHSPELAAIAYNNAAKKYFGEFAKLNQI